MRTPRTGAPGSAGAIGGRPQNALRGGCAPSAANDAQRPAAPSARIASSSGARPTAPATRGPRPRVDSMVVATPRPAGRTPAPGPGGATTSGVTRVSASAAARGNPSRAAQAVSGAIRSGTRVTAHVGRAPGHWPLRRLRRAGARWGRTVRPLYGLSTGPAVARGIRTQAVRQAQDARPLHRLRPILPRCC